MHPQSWGSQFLGFAFMVLVGCLLLRTAARTVEAHLSFILLTLSLIIVVVFIVKAVQSHRQDW